MAETLFDKIWARHEVRAETDAAPAVLYVDLHLVHEVSSPQAFEQLAKRGLAVRRPNRCLATLDHAIPTLAAGPDGVHLYATDQAQRQVELLRHNCALHGIELFDWDSPQRGIVHVIGPEIGATQPGMTIVCGDSHTSTHGAFGTLAFGIGSTEVAHVLATQCVLQRKPRTMKIEIDGSLRTGVSAKDVILHVISKIGVHGASGCVIEYTGSTVRQMDMEARMTLCNMSIECGARAGMVGPDETTIEYLRGRPRAPSGPAWSACVTDWMALRTDPGAHFDHAVHIDAAAIRPTITFGTNPGMAIAIGDHLPQRNGDALDKALDYMGFKPEAPLLGQKIDIVFIGSCTNARLSDLREVATVLKGRRVASGTRVIIVPGSETVKREAEREGLDQVFTAAGAEWRHSGCSMCIAMNGDMAQPGQYVVSTSNRNFEGRQGSGARTMLASPRTAAVCAVTGEVTDPDTFLEQAHG
ncbi:MAG TPA: 3-isopropylmalate dehydratase large subunit [Xanthomonadales bacterium]|nr:3-isopropylmalate dehydratase large subunit [Xanthomonadales bacterium]